jgi:hypothetical protein
MLDSPSHAHANYLVLVEGCYGEQDEKPSQFELSSPRVGNTCFGICCFDLVKKKRHLLTTSSASVICVVSTGCDTNDRDKTTQQFKCSE